MAVKPLPTLVRDLMTVGVVTCSPHTSIRDLAEKMLTEDLDELVVLDEGKALGIVGRDDIVAAFNHEDPQSLNAEDLMREGIPQVPPDIPLAAAAQIMRDRGVRTLFLMHHAGGIEYPAAMLTYKHLLRYLGARQQSDLHNLGIEATRQTPLETYFQKRDSLRLKNFKDET
jgi:CBS domain-containing protein